MGWDRTKHLPLSLAETLLGYLERRCQEERLSAKSEIGRIRDKVQAAHRRGTDPVTIRMGLGEWDVAAVLCAKYEVNKETTVSQTCYLICCAPYDPEPPPPPDPAIAAAAARLRATPDELFETRGPLEPEPVKPVKEPKAVTKVVTPQKSLFDD